MIVIFTIIYGIIAMGIFWYHCSIGKMAGQDIPSIIFISLFMAVPWPFILIDKMLMKPLDAVISRIFG